MNTILQDVRYGLRQLRKSPGFTATAILTLALGIGATTALFSVVNGVLLKPLAYRDSGRLVVIWERVRFLQKLWPYIGANARHEDMWRRQSTAFADMTLLSQGSTGVSLRSTDHPQLVGKITAQPNLLDILGVQPVIGRNFLPEESIKGHEKVAIISWHLWQTFFHGESSALGKMVLVAGAPFEVVGVLPSNFYFPKANELAPVPLSGRRPDNEIISPLVIDLNSNYGWNSDYGNYVALGRLKPGVSVAQATENLNLVDDDIALQIPPNQIDGPAKGALATYVQPMKEVLVGRTAPRLWLLMAAVVSVLLIACTNLANAQLARLASRDREAALRTALGASAVRLLQNAMAEVALLSVFGGVCGIALAVFAVHRFASFAELAMPRTGAITVSLPVLALSVLLTVGAGVIFGLLPSLRLLRIDPQNALQSGTRSAGSRRGSTLRRWLVGAQVFACTTLLLVGGLFARSLVKLSTLDKGFSSSNVIAADVLLQGKDFAEDKVRAEYDDGVLGKLRSLPGVESASLVSYKLLNGDGWIDGVKADDNPNAETLANYRWVGPDYFAILRQRIVEGRPLDGRDRTARNVVISQATAAAAWPGRSPINHQFKHNGSNYTVVGVVSDAHSLSLRSAPGNIVYLPYWDNPPFNTYFLVRGTQDPALLSPTVREAIWSYNPSVTIARVHTLDSQVSDSLSPESLETGIFVAFGGAALLLALLGIFGTLSNAVEARTQEVGIRMALGATRQSIYSLMLQTILAPVALGLVLGCLASFSAGKSLSALLYGTSPTDLAVVGPVVCVFVLAAAVATYVPCRRAAMTEPTVALKAD